MSFYEESSIIITPNAYKGGTLYAVVPTSGAADMDVTRATAATRVDESGLVNYAEILGDEDVVNGDFSDGLTGWVGNPETTLSVSNNELDIQSSSAGGEYGAAFSEVNFELGKQYIVQLTVVSCNAPTQIRVGSITTTTSYSQNIWASGDIGIGTHSKVYTPSQNYPYLAIGGRNDVTTLVIDNVSVKEVTRDNVPRIDYTGGGCPHILAEPQRTNLITYSDVLNSTTGSTLSNSISPDGTLNGLKLNETTGNTQHYGTSHSAPVVNGTTYTISFYIKKGTYDEVIVYTSSSRISASVEIEFSTESTTLTGGIAGSNFMEDSGNGWYRVGFSGVAILSGNMPIFLPIKNLSTYAGSTSQYTEYWGLQVEQGSYATSYIPTLGSTVTRNQDVFTRDGISSLINSTEGVLFVEMAALADDGTSRDISVSDGSSSNYARISLSNAVGNIEYNVVVGGSTKASGVSAITQTNFNKIAVKWKINDFALWVNGSEVLTDLSGTSFTASTLTTLNFDRGSGTNYFYGKVNQLQVYPTALSDAELTTLTTL